MNGQPAILSIRNLRLSIRTDEGIARVLDHIDFALDPGGIELLESTLALFRAALLSENRTLKRALTDPSRAWRFIKTPL
mgnify:CR=1 FL=1